MPIMQQQQVHPLCANANATNVTREQTGHEISPFKLFSTHRFIKSTIYIRSNAINSPVLIETHAASIFNFFSDSFTIFDVHLNIQ